MTFSRDKYLHVNILYSSKKKRKSLFKLNKTGRNRWAYQELCNSKKLKTLCCIPSRSNALACLVNRQLHWIKINKQQNNLEEICCIVHRITAILILQVIKLEGLRLTSATGMTVFLNWLLLTVIDDFVDRNQMQLFHIIREASWKAYAEHFMTVLPHLDIQYMSKWCTNTKVLYKILYGGRSKIHTSLHRCKVLK